jgi:hypothetical protein
LIPKLSKVMDSASKIPNRQRYSMNHGSNVCESATNISYVNSYAVFVKYE